MNLMGLIIQNNINSNNK